jgi:aspartate 1-decarboxylase
MRREVLRAKIHRATVTQADLDYEGSITIPPDLMEAADMIEFEKVAIWNVTRGTRFETYTFLGKPGSRDICINGAAAHLAQPGDLVIIAAFTTMREKKARKWQPLVVFVDEQNRIKEIRSEELPHSEEDDHG